MTRPMELPAVKEGVYLKVDGVEYLAFDEQGAVELGDYITIAEANTALADENASALLARKKQINRLLEAGKLTEEQAAMLLEAYEEERRFGALQSLFLNGLLAVALLGLAL